VPDSVTTKCLAKQRITSSRRAIPSDPPLAEDLPTTAKFRGQRTAMTGGIDKRRKLLQLPAFNPELISQSAAKLQVSFNFH
jgi:hypothetical protein